MRTRLILSSAVEAAAKKCAPVKTSRSSKTCTGSMFRNSLGTNYDFNEEVRQFKNVDNGIIIQGWSRRISTRLYVHNLASLRKKL